MPDEPRATPEPCGQDALAHEQREGDLDDRVPQGRDPSVALLAVDLGLRAGLAGFSRTGQLVFCRSTHFPSPARMKVAIPGILAHYPALQRLALEGDANLARLWRQAAERRGIRVHQLPAEVWRQGTLLPREQRRGDDAKRAALVRARQIIKDAGLSPPKTLRHDAAEAVLLGLFVARAELTRATSTRRHSGGG